MYICLLVSHPTVITVLCSRKLAPEAVQGPALPLQCVDHGHGGDGLALGVLGVGDGVADHVLQEDLEDAAGLLVDEILLTPPLLARRWMASLVMPWATWL